MVPQITLLAAFAAIFVAQAAHGLRFEGGHTFEYNYTANVKAGTDDPVPYVSEFLIHATVQLTVEPVERPSKNVLHVQLSNVRHGMRNGAADPDLPVARLIPIGEDVGVLHQPFLIIYEPFGMLHGVKIPADEPVWSKNMKIAMASMLELDLVGIDIDTTFGHQAFVIEKSTIHGKCFVTYGVSRKEEPLSNEYVIMTHTTPTNCSGFDSRSFNHVDVDSCQPTKEEPLSVNNHRYVEVQKNGEEIRINKLVAESLIKYIPWNRLTRHHYAATSAEFNLDKVLPMIETRGSDFLNVSVTLVPFNQKTEERYAPNAAIDPTHGRHVVDLASLVPELRQMLEEAVDYMEENHLKAEEPNWKHGHTINRILRTMSLMDIPSLELIFHAYQDSKVPRDISIKTLFCDMIPQVGTPATSLFTLRLVRESKVPEGMAIAMLKNLPMNVKSPSPKLLQQLEDLLRFDDSVSIHVRKASVLCFSALMHRTFRDLVRPSDNLLLQKYLREFLTRVEDDPSYDMKIVYLMAMRNVEFGYIHHHLAPIITGELTISKNPVHIRLLAIWAVEKAIVNDGFAIDKFLFPIMVNVALPLKLRVAAYDIMIRVHDVDRLNRIDWFMDTETNKHFLNYHYTTVKNLAKADDPCKRRLRERMERITRFDTKHAGTRLTLSSAYYFDEYITSLGVSEKIDGALVFDEKTGDPEVARFDYYLASGPESIVDVGVRLHIEGLGGLKDHRMFAMFSKQDGILDEKVLRVLSNARKNLPPSAEVHVDVVLTREGRVVLANHYDRRTFTEMYRDVTPYIFAGAKDDFILNHRSVKYERLSQKQVTNDVGLPVMMDIQEPIVASFKFNYDVLPTTPNDETRTVGVDLSLEVKLWQYGEYSLSTYNPIADAWHATRRNTAMDIGFPFRAIVSLSPATDTLKIRFPPLAESKNAVAGLRLYMKDSVTVEARDGAEKLKRSCPTCEVEKDFLVPRADTSKWSGKYDNELTGLKASIALLNCQVFKNENPARFYRSFWRSFGDRDPWSAESDITTRREVKKMFFSSRIGNCGILMKIEPSERYPSSSVEIKLHREFRPTEEDAESYFVLHAETYKLDATLDVISGATNASVLSLSAKFNVDKNHGHTTNEANLRLQLKTAAFSPSPIFIQFCIAAESNYPPYTSDLLSLQGAANQETNSTLTIKWSKSEGEDCDKTVYAVSVKGQLSDEQMSRIGRSPVTRPCAEDLMNRGRYGFAANRNHGRYGYAANINHVPMTLNCLNEAITYTTLRKYTIDLKREGMPPLDPQNEYSYRKGFNWVRPTDVKLDVAVVDPKTLRLTAEFLMEANEPDSRGVVRRGWLENYNRRVRKPVGAVEPMYHFPLANTRFSNDFLHDYTEDAIRLCVVHPHSILTADEKIVRFELSKDKWTLVTGDHEHKTFAVFAKSHGKFGNLVATKIYVGSRRVEIWPDENSSFNMTVDDLSIIDELMANAMISTSDPGGQHVSVKKWNDCVVVELPQVPSFSVVIHPFHLMVTINSFLFQGKVSGLCGHLAGNYTTSIPEFYTLE